MFHNKFAFSYTWSIGGSLTTESRKPFDIFMKRLFNCDIDLPKEVPRKKISLPERGTLFDYALQNRDGLSTSGKKTPAVEFI
jgi:dynein heavy chain